MDCNRTWFLSNMKFLFNVICFNILRLPTDRIYLSGPSYTLSVEQFKSMCIVEYFSIGSWSCCSGLKQDCGIGYSSSG